MANEHRSAELGEARLAIAVLQGRLARLTAALIVIRDDHVGGCQSQGLTDHINRALEGKA